MSRKTVPLMWSKSLSNLMEMWALVIFNNCPEETSPSRYIAAASTFGDRL
jgi:hypothetical protein